MAVNNFAHNVLPFSYTHIFLCNGDILAAFCDGKRKSCLNENWEYVIPSSLENLKEFQVDKRRYKFYQVILTFNISINMIHDFQKKNSFGLQYSKAN